MRTIHKYTLKHPLPYSMSLTWLEHPILSFVSAGIQGSGSESLKIWAEVNTELDPKLMAPDQGQRLILVAGTGANLDLIHPAAKQLIGTIVDPAGYVWHVYALKGDKKVLQRVYSAWQASLSQERLPTLLGG